MTKTVLALLTLVLSLHAAAAQEAIALSVEGWRTETRNDVVYYRSPGRFTGAGGGGVQGPAAAAGGEHWRLKKNTAAVATRRRNRVPPRGGEQGGERGRGRGGAGLKWARG